MKFGCTSSMMIGAAGLLAAAGAASAQVPWSNPSGAGSFFTWSSGQSGLGLFGNPTLVGGNQFFFSPTNFGAQSVGGVPADTTDQLQVRLLANAGQRFTHIRIQEFGSWAITGIGSVRESGTEFITDLITPGRTAMQNLQTNPVMPIATAGSGDWTGDVDIDLTQIIGPDWTFVQFQFTNTLQATTGNAQSVSEIHKKGVGGPAIIVTVLPAPGSAALLGVAGLLAMRRRR
jgi:hypothetical protein